MGNLCSEPATDPGIEVIKLSDNRLSEYSTLQFIAYGTHWAVNIFKIVVLYMWFGIYQSRTITRHTRFPGNDTSCLELYDYNTLARWAYFIFAFNYIDARASINVAQKFWGRIVIVFNCVSLVVNFGLSVVWLIYLGNCNELGSSNTTNICTSGMFCGLSANINEELNNCLAKNPSGLALCSQYQPDRLPKDPRYWVFGVCVIACLLFDLIKVITDLILPDAIEWIRKVQTYFQRNAENLKELKPIEVYSDEVTPKPVTPENAYTNIEFLTIYRVGHKLLYIPELGLDIGLGLGIWAQFGWYLQNVKTYKEFFTVTSAGCTRFDTKTVPDLTVFVAIFALIPMFWMGLAKINNIFDNHHATISSIFGFAVCVILLVWNGFYTATCNLPGYPSNPCHDTRLCGSVGPESNYTIGHWVDPANECPNNFNCAQMWRRDQMVMDPEWQINYIFIGYAAFAFLFIAAFTLAVQRYINSHIKSSKDQAIDEQKRIATKVSENVVENTVLHQSMPVDPSQLVGHDLPSYMPLVNEPTTYDPNALFQSIPEIPTAAQQPNTSGSLDYQHDYSPDTDEGTDDEDEPAVVIKEQPPKQPPVTYIVPPVPQRRPYNPYRPRQ
jgi:hypothetical protein